MEFDSPEQLRGVLVQCLEHSLREFTQDLERRIAVVLYSKLPQATVVNMAQTISRELGAWLTAEVVQSQAYTKALDKLL